MDAHRLPGSRVQGVPGGSGDLTPIPPTVSRDLRASWRLQPGRVSTRPASQGLTGRLASASLYTELRSFSMHRSVPRQPSRSPLESQRVFTDEAGLLWSASLTRSGGGAVEFSCIGDARRPVR